MKTIQQCFIESDEADLIQQYIFAHPFQITLLEDSDENISTKQAFMQYHDNIKNLICKIKTIEIQPSSDTWIFFVHHTIDEYNNDICVSLVKKSDILDKNTYTFSYAYEFTSLAESAGFCVADTYLTQYYLQDILIDYLYEMSCFGWDQEYLEKTAEQLLQDSEYVDEHLDELLENCDASDIKPNFELEHYDESERAAWSSYLEHQINYCKIAFEIEENKLLKSLEVK